MITNLLDDQGGMEEIYTKEELFARYSYSRTISMFSPWHDKWMKGIHVQRDRKTNRILISYCGVTVIVPEIILRS